MIFILSSVYWSMVIYHLRILNVIDVFSLILCVVIWWDLARQKCWILFKRRVIFLWIWIYFHLFALLLDLWYVYLFREHITGNAWFTTGIVRFVKWVRCVLRMSLLCNQWWMHLLGIMDWFIFGYSSSSYCLFLGIANFLSFLSQNWFQILQMGTLSSFIMATLSASSGVFRHLTNNFFASLTVLNT